MQIDWITVAAQIANFLVLVWLLQRFLYKPITQAMKRREQTIEDRLSEAKSARKDAEDEAETLRQKQEDLEESKQGILDEAREEAKELRERLETEAREEMQERREDWRINLEEERDDFAKTLRLRAGHQVISITEQMLRDYAQADLDDQVAEGFIARLDELDDETCKKLKEASADADDPAIVESSAAVKSGSRGKITRAVRKAFSSDLDIDYRHDKDLLLGIRLTVGEQTLEWSAARHLKRLDSTLDEVIESSGALAPSEASSTTDS